MTIDYQPNFKNPRVIKRVEDVLLFAWSHRNMEEMRHWGRAYLDAVFGKADNEMSAFLRSVLLICTNEKYSKDAGVTKQYLVNPDGVIFLIKCLSGTTTQSWSEWNVDRSSPQQSKMQKYQPTVNSLMSATPTKSAGSMSAIEQEKLIDLFNEKFEYELQSGEFEYEEKGQRDFNRFQSLPKVVRNPIASKNGYRYDYDIDCAQPTLISQFAKMKGMQEDTPAIDYYIHNKTIVRTRLSKLLYIDAKHIKKVLTALFNNAPIALPFSDEFIPSIYKELGCNDQRVILLKNDPFVKQLKLDIKECWDYLAATDNLLRREQTDEDGTITRVRRSGKDYAATYRQQETIVSRCIRNYLHSKSFKMISIHDGWNCQQEVDTLKVIDHVYEQTGYKVNLTLTLL